jgi:ubiquinone/menaquinone biosynthesis C-methylase UbiE
MAASAVYTKKADSSANDFHVSHENRSKEIQEIIDESFKVYVQPLHEQLVAGELLHYREFGTEDYEFIDPEDSKACIRSSKFVEKFAKDAPFSVLDLGAGNGRFIAGLKEKFKNVVVMGVSAADFRSGYSDFGYAQAKGAWIIGDPNIKNLMEFLILNM